MPKGDRVLVVLGSAACVALFAFMIVAPLVLAVVVAVAGIGFGWQAFRHHG